MVYFKVGSAAGSEYEAAESVVQAAGGDTDYEGMELLLKQTSKKSRKTVDQTPGGSSSAPGPLTKVSSNSGRKKSGGGQT